jgi:hypothetical protein
MAVSHDFRESEREPLHAHARARDVSGLFTQIGPEGLRPKNDPTDH